MFDSAQLAPHSMLPGLLDVHQSDGGSGASTPPLWHNSPPNAPIRSSDVYRSLSPASRTQAILRGQRELMDMVRNLPESSYELSLKDLVELPPPPPPRMLLNEEKRPSFDSDVNSVMKRSYGRRGYGYGNRTTTMTTARCGSMGKGQQQQEGLLLKMVFPVYTGAAVARARRTGNRRQTKERSEEDSSATEKEWWRKRDGDSESGDSLYSSTISGSGKSSGSGSSSGSSRSNSANSNNNTIVAVR